VDGTCGTHGGGGEGIYGVLIGRPEGKSTRNS
jgi:hypothetical protein